MVDDPEGALLEAVQRDPSDVQARIVYADWLEERGDPRGEYIRLELQLTSLPERLEQLVQQIDPAWVHAIGGSFQISLAGTSPNKINLIKTIRELTGIGLRECLELVDSASEAKPVVVFENVDLARATEIRAKLSPIVPILVTPRLTPAIAPQGPQFHTGEYRRRYRVLLVRVEAARRAEAIHLVHQRTARPITEARDIIDRVQAGTPFVLADVTDATTAAELAVQLGAYGYVRIEHVPAP